MPANLTPQYFEAERAYKQARTVAERIEGLENMLAVMPKHKGTDKLRADLRARIARLREEEERGRGGAARAHLYRVKREGAGQALLVGLPNSGKSSLLSALTSAASRVADYPFTTQYPLPGMMRYQDVQVQIVDTPAITHPEARAWLGNLLRSADLLLLVVDLGGEPGCQLIALNAELAAMRVKPLGRGDAPPQEPDVGRPAVIVANKEDVEGALEKLQALRQSGYDFALVGVSAVAGTGLDELRQAVWLALDRVRVYTRVGGQKALGAPFVLRRGSTVEDVADVVHKDLRRRLRYAQVWGSGKFDGQQVNRGYVLQDGDVVELHG